MDSSTICVRMLGFLGGVGFGVVAGGKGVMWTWVMVFIRECGGSV